MIPRFIKVRILFLCSLLIFAAAGQISAQTTPADSMPVIQSSANYAMPQAAIDAGIDGTVVVGLHVSDSGKVEKVWVLAGPMWPCGKTPEKALEELSTTLEATLKTVKFLPATKDGKPVEQDISLSLKLKNPSLEPAALELDAAGKPKAKLVTGGVLNGKAKILEKPRYPVVARDNRDGGTVHVQVLIDEKGDVLRAGATNGARTLQFASRDAACQSKFSPTTLAGNPVKVSGIITYNFVP